MGVCSSNNSSKRPIRENTDNREEEETEIEEQAEIEILLLSNSGPLLSNFVNSIHKTCQVTSAWPHKFNPNSRVVHDTRVTFGEKENTIQFHILPPCTKNDVRTGWEAFPPSHCVIQLVDLRHIFEIHNVDLLRSKWKLKLSTTVLIMKYAGVVNDFDCSVYFSKWLKQKRQYFLVLLTHADDMNRMTHENQVIWSQNVAKQLHKFRDGSDHFAPVNEIFEQLSPNQVIRVNSGTYTDPLRNIIQSLVQGAKLNDGAASEEQFWVNE